MTPGGLVFQDAGTNASLDVFAASRFQDHRFDTGLRQVLAQQQAGGTRADDCNLSAHGWYCRARRGQTPWTNRSGPGTLRGMTLLTLRDAQLAYRRLPELDHAQLTVQEGERIGLIGRNGTGKSTLLKVVTGMASLDDGAIERRDGLRIAYR